MKQKSIYKYLFAEHLKSQVKAIFILFAISLLVLTFLNYYTLMQTASSNIVYVSNVLSNFLSPYNEISLEINKNQNIRNMLTHINQFPDDYEKFDFSTEENIEIYSLHYKIYPEYDNSKTIDARDFYISDTKIIYNQPIYNFVATEIIGYVSFEIKISEFELFLSQNIPHSIIFDINDSDDNLIFQREHLNFNYSTTEHLENLSITTFVDSETLNSVLILYLLCFIPIVIIIIFSSYMKSKKISESITMPISLLINQIKQNQVFGKVENLDYVGTKFDEISLLTETFLEYSSTINDLIEQNHKTNLIKTESTLYSLQQNINPHFLFNTLEIISAYAMGEDANETSLLVQKLGKLFRFNLKASDVVTLEQEISYTKNYFELQNLCVNNEMTLNIDIPYEYSKLQIPKLTFQPILENSFKYAFDETDDKQVSITARPHDNYLHITISDNGKGIEDISKILNSFKMDQENFEYFITNRKSLGLRNVNYKLKTFANESISITNNCGTEIQIKIPLGEDYDNKNISY